MFAKYDCDEKGGLTITDLWSLWNGQKLVFDFFGWTATALECMFCSFTPINSKLRGRSHDRDRRISPLAGCWSRTRGGCPRGFRREHLLQEGRTCRKPGGTANTSISQPHRTIPTDFELFADRCVPRPFNSTCHRNWIVDEGQGLISDDARRMVKCETLMLQ